MSEGKLIVTTALTRQGAKIALENCRGCRTIAWMRAITAAFAYFLSAMVILTPVSASACDLSCALRQTHSDCHDTGSPSVGQTMSMSMPGMEMNTSSGTGTTGMDSMDMPGMNMVYGPTQKGHTAGQGFGARSSHYMSPQFDIEMPRLDNILVPGLIAGSPLTHSQRLSGCTQELCVQHFVSTSPPNSTVSHPHFMHLVTAESLNTANLWAGVHGVRPPVLPPEGPSVTDLSTTLRI